MSKHSRQGGDHTRGDRRATAPPVALAYTVRREPDALAAMVEPCRPRRHGWLDRLVQRQAEPVPRLGR